MSKLSHDVHEDVEQHCSQSTNWDYGEHSVKVGELFSRGACRATSAANLDDDRLEKKNKSINIKHKLEPFCHYYFLRDFLEF